MKFIKLTDPGGGAVWIAGQWVTRVQSAVRGQHATGARTVISMGAKEQAVAESPEQVVQILEGKGEIS
jgi:hypothetical protein